ncbi:hypothetical protein [Streptomyces sp. NPDC060194]|uniref:hypothetical protein n=1 Tax=Streptomyces sp. NPDC060194 TaxID=3347069 RepID=UPI00364E67FD
MEQRREESIPPVNTAASDPGAVPGLTPAPRRAPEPEPAREPAVETGAAVDAEPDADAEEAAVEDRVPVADGPAFEASDRRAAVVADASGVRLRLDDQEAEFGWDEIAAVEYDTPRFGRRLSVVVHLPNHRWYPGDVEAPSKTVLSDWTTSLDSVLDTYFHD